jgi:hypothetical protein
MSRTAPSSPTSPAFDFKRLKYVLLPAWQR